MTVDVLIVGGTGLLGSAIVELVEARDLDWAATHHSTLRSGPRWHGLDLADAAAVGALLDRLAPRAIVNAAYRPGGDLLEPVTRDAPVVMAQWAAAASARLVQLSTDLVFDGDLGRAYTEADPPSPRNEYGRAKATMEAAVLAVDPGAVVVRTSLLWGGPGDGGPQVHLVRNPDVRFFTDEFRNPLDVSSLAEACLELVERTEISGLLHFAGPERVDRLTLARALAVMAGVDPDSLQAGTGASVPGRPADVSLDSSLADRLLSVERRGLPRPPST